MCDIDEGAEKKLAEDTGADFFTTDIDELLDRSEVNAAIIATDASTHVAPVRAAAERGLPMLVEKPLATGARESAELLSLIERNGSDTVIGYTQRFRRRFLVAKEKVGAGELGDVTTVVSRAFLNSLTPIGTLQAADEIVTKAEAAMTTEDKVRAAILEGMDPQEAFVKFQKF